MSFSTLCTLEKSRESQGFENTRYHIINVVLLMKSMKNIMYINFFGNYIKIKSSGWKHSCEEYGRIAQHLTMQEEEHQTILSTAEKQNKSNLFGDQNYAYKTQP